MKPATTHKTLIHSEFSAGAVKRLNEYAKHLEQIGDNVRAADTRSLARAIQKDVDDFGSYSSAVVKEQVIRQSAKTKRVNGEAQITEVAEEVDNSNIPWGPSNDGSTHVYMPAGIGDTYWAWQKLAAFESVYKSKLFIHISNESPQRAQPAIEVLRGARFGGNHPIGSGAILGWMDRHPDKVPTRAKDFVGCHVRLAINRHVEAGLPVEDWLPDLPMKWDLDIDTTKEHKAKALAITGEGRGRIIGLYPAAYSPSRNWRFFCACKDNPCVCQAEKGWVRMAKALAGVTGASFVVIGASFDSDLCTSVLKGLKEARLNAVACIGQEWGTAVEVLRRLNLLLGFPSGLPITSVMIGTRTIWWLPNSPQVGGGNVNRVTGWIKPEWVEEGRIESRAFESPEAAIEGILASGPFAAMMRSMPQMGGRR